MKKQIHGGDVYRHPQAIDFSSNMNPLGTPESVIKAGEQAMHEIAQYPDVQCEKLKNALSESEQVLKEWLICGNGAAEVVFTYIHALMPKKAVMPAPTFAEYGLALNSIGCEIDRVQLLEKNGFAITSLLEQGTGNAESAECTDSKENAEHTEIEENTGYVQSDVKGTMEEFLNHITEATDVVFFCNPNNPTGVLASKDQLYQLLEHCQKTDTRLFLDECFLDFVENPEKDSMKMFLKEYPNLMILKAFTKRYAMAGIRLGYGITSDEKLITRMQACVQPWNLSIPAQAAGVAALSETAYVEEGRTIIKKEREWLREQMQMLGLKLYDSAANYIFFKGPDDLTEKCLEHQILIRDCSNYEGLKDGYYRVAVKLHEQNVKLVETLKIIIERG